MFHHVTFCFLLNALIWAIGNSFAGSTLVVYFVTALGVANIGLTISAIKASPQIAGLLRMAAAGMLDRFTRRFRLNPDTASRRFTVIMHALSVVVLAAFPWLAMTEIRFVHHTPDGGGGQWAMLAVAAIVMVWCVHHLLEYLGTVVLWSWTAERIAVPQRKRFFAMRNAALCAGFFCGGLIVWWFGNLQTSSGTHTRIPEDYALTAAIGAALLGLAILPLMRVPPATTEQTSTSPQPPSPTFTAIIRCEKFRRVLHYGVVMAAIGGLIQSTQYLYAILYLRIPFETMLMLEATLRIGQTLLSPWIGGLLARRGYRAVLVPSTLVLAACGIAFLTATPENRVPYYIGWVMYLAWTGVNIGIPARLAGFGDTHSRTIFIGCHQALTGGVLAVTTILGGVLVDRLMTTWTPVAVFRVFLAIGIAGRIAASAVAARFPEDESATPTPAHRHGQ